MVDELDAEEFARPRPARPRRELALKAYNDPVRMYLKEIGKVPLLTLEQEVILAKAIDGEAATAEIDKATDNGRKLTDPAARTPAHRAPRPAGPEEADRGLHLVVSIAKQYVGRGMLFLDLIPGQPRPHPGRGEVRLQQRASSSPPTPPGGSARPSPGPSPTRPAHPSRCTWSRRSTS